MHWGAKTQLLDESHDGDVFYNAMGIKKSRTTGLLTAKLFTAMQWAGRSG